MNQKTQISPKERIDTLLEALLFASEDPLTCRDLAAFSGKPEADVSQGLQVLEERLQFNSGMILQKIAGGFRLETRPEYYETIREMFIDRRSSKLSMAALETLALVAYKQPITAIEIAELRMVTSVSSIVRNLLEKKMIKPVGRKKVIGRPMMYATTKGFLLHFGLNQLTDLPSLEDFQEKLAEEQGEPDTDVTEGNDPSHQKEELQ